MERLNSVSYGRMGKVFKNRPSKICGREPLCHMSWIVFSYSILNSVLLNFLKLMQSCCSDKFPFLFWYSQIGSKFVSKWLQIRFKFASNWFFLIIIPINLWSFVMTRFVGKNWYKVCQGKRHLCNKICQCINSNKSNLFSELHCQRRTSSQLHVAIEF